MAQIQVPQQYADELQEVALREERPVEDVVGEAIQAYLYHRLYEPELTTPQIGRMKHSLDQAARGELVSQAEVEAFFDDWEKEASSK